MAERPLAEQLDQVVESALAGETAVQNGQTELAALAEIVHALRLLPSTGFKMRLKTELQRRTPMSAPTEVRAGFRTVSPFIVHERAPELVEFLRRTFEAEELQRNTSQEAYGFYSEVRIGDSVVMIGGGSAAARGNLPGAFHVFVDDCDAAYRRALEAGATTLMGAMGEPADRPYGERSAFVEDAFGSYWYIATRLAQGRSEGGAGSVVPYLHPESVRRYIGFLKAAFGAEEMTVVEHAGRVMHAAVRIGDAVLEMGEPEDRSSIPLGGFFVRVDDVDGAYARALAAGATIVRPPDDIPYGYRSAIVKDHAGYLWWTARLMHEGA
jgi:uncharacterized glyoxalase superfamily protein PhnB